ncbi:MAG: nickel-dependent lactate racemase [Desulfobacterota bacterium]|nr:nickel-dependent lactate racemase [Thermodesulfobacteriota bacterium]
MDLPRMYRIGQTFDRTAVGDVEGTIREELSKHDLRKKVRPGDRVAITAGSRGISQIDLILKTLVDYLRFLGAQPFLFPAMGSHGGATAEGQVALLRHYRITEEAIGAPILSSMEVAEIGRTRSGLPVYIDRQAFEADHVVVVNRIKPHTKFKGPIESGLMKMMAIGMGKQKGAELAHRAAIDHGFPKVIEEVATVVLDRMPILFGLGIIENGYDETAALVGLSAREIREREPELLAQAKQWMPKLPFDQIDLLIVDEMGKDVSGVGMDPNVTGRNRDILGTFPHPTSVRRLFVRDLTPNSNGNAIGIGLADLTTKRLVERIDPRATYTNCITAISLEKAAIPMAFETDREAIEVGLGSIGLTPPERARIVRIKNTLQVDEVEVSEIYKEELLERTDLRVLEGPYPMRFDPKGNLLPFLAQERRRKELVD